MNQIIHIQYKKAGYIARLYNLHRRTLYNYSDKGLIRYITKNDTNIRYYNIRDVIRSISEETIPGTDEKEICYARISKKEDIKILEEQIQYFKTNFPLYEIIYDISDDINDNFSNIINNVKDKKVSILILYDNQTISSESLKYVSMLFRIYYVEIFICNKTSST